MAATNTLQPVLLDPANNVELNFLKWNHACLMTRWWALELFNQQQSNPGGNYYPTGQTWQFQYAWDNCPDPFWMLWALQLGGANCQVAGNPPTLYTPGEYATRLAVDALNQVPRGSYVGNLWNILGDLTNFVRNGVAFNQATAFVNVQQAATLLGGTTQVNDKARAASALLAGLVCANGNNISAADQAWGLAKEAQYYAAGAGVNWTNWKQDRTNLAQQTVHPLFDPVNTVQALNLVKTMAETTYVNPPPWARNTDHLSKTQIFQPRLPPPAWVPHASKDIDVPVTATPPASWHGTGSKGSTYWDAYGTDDNSNFTSRSAWVSDASNNILCNGTYVSPPGGTQYQWGYSFTLLTIGQTVNVNVQWNYPNTGPTIQTVTCVVAGTN